MWQIDFLFSPFTLFYSLIPFITFFYFSSPNSHIMSTSLESNLSPSLSSSTADLEETYIDFTCHLAASQYHLQTSRQLPNTTFSGRHSSVSIHSAKVADYSSSLWSINHSAALSSLSDPVDLWHNPLPPIAYYGAFSTIYPDIFVVFVAAERVGTEIRVSKLRVAHRLYLSF